MIREFSNKNLWNTYAIKQAKLYFFAVEEELFNVGFCLPAGPYVTDEDVHYIVECIKEAIVR